MPFFLATLGVGRGGRLLLALPGLRRHGHSGHVHAHVHARAHSHAAGPAHGPAHGHAAAHAVQGPRHGVMAGLLQYMPEPHLIFSFLALLGALGNVFQRALRLPAGVSALGAGAIALLLDWLVIARLWRFVFRFTGTPASPLTSLLMDQAEAVTAFHNGRGIVRAVLDGRAVQLSAELIPEQSTLTVRVGDRMTIQDVDSDREHVRVSVQ